MSADKDSQPAEIGFLFEETRRLHTLWDCFEQLLPTPARSALHAHAGHLLPELRVALAESIVMIISRLCDRVCTGNRKNLVFQKFLDDHPTLKVRTERSIEQLRSIYEGQLKPVRHRRLAHNDLRTLCGEEVMSGPRIGVLREAKQLSTEIVQELAAASEHVAISFPQSSVPFEVDWIEAALRYVNQDPKQIDRFLSTIRKERGIAGS